MCFFTFHVNKQLYSSFILRNVSILFCLKAEMQILFILVLEFHISVLCIKVVSWFHENRGISLFCKRSLRILWNLFCHWIWFQLSLSLYLNHHLLFVLLVGQKPLWDHLCLCSLFYKSHKNKQLIGKINIFNLLLTVEHGKGKYEVIFSLWVIWAWISYDAQEFIKFKTLLAVRKLLHLWCAWTGYLLWWLLIIIVRSTKFALRVYYWWTIVLFWLRLAFTVLASMIASSYAVQFYRHLTIAGRKLLFVVV